MTDIAAAAQIAHDAGALLLTDCTATPPCATKALALGADISFHSATKYLNGHSDIAAGVLSTNDTGAMWQEIFEIRKLQGTVLQAFDAWLLLRGMRTLFLRYERQTGGQYGGMLSIIVNGSEQTAIDVARYCKVFFPATSLGGVESLIEHRKTVSGEGFPVDPRLLRLSIGIEDVADLIADLEQALDRAT